MHRDIAFGVTDHIDRQDRPIHETYDSRLKLVEMYDRAGIHAYHLTEHHFTPLGLAPSPNVFIGAASRITTNIRFAPLILILPLYNPLRLASEICMLDHLTHGRYEFAVGRGISPYELAYHNVPHLEAAAMFEEGQQVLMQALTQDVVDFRGRYYNHFGVPIEMTPFQRPHPPMWVATGNLGGAAAAAERNLNVAFNRPSRVMRPQADRYWEVWNEHHGASGKPMPKVGISRGIFVAETDEEAHERGLHGHRGFYEKFSHLWQKFDPRPADKDAAEKQVGQTVIFGSPETVREAIARDLEEANANYMILRFAFGELTHEESARSVQLFVDEVMPHFANGAATPAGKTVAV